MRVQSWVARKEYLLIEVNNKQNSTLQKINFLTELYFHHQHDVLAQAKYVRQIQELSNGR